MAAALAVAGCGAERSASSGSVLEGPRRWEAVRGFDGEALEEWVRADGPLPPDTLSVTLTATGLGEEVLSFGVRDVAGQVLVEIGRPEFSPNRLLRGRRTVVGMLPSGSATLPLSPNFRVRAVRLGQDPLAPDDHPLAVAAWVKRSGRTAAAPEVQELPLTVFLVGGAPDDARVAIALGEVGRIWRRAAVEIREPARLRLSGDDGERFDRIEVHPMLGSDSPDVAALLRLSERGPGVGLSLFFVPDILSAGVPVWAVSGAIPVPPVAGTSRSGIAVNASLLDVDPVWAGQVIAHEIGHALGLYHTTERELRTLDGARRPVHDTLDDTPGCPLEADRDRDGVLSSAECEGHDAANLMFWAATRDGTRLSAGQSDLARRAAIVR